MTTPARRARPVLAAIGAIALAAGLGLAAAAPAYAATITVTTESPTGAGSLNDAIVQANASPGSTINFNPSVHTIDMSAASNQAVTASVTVAGSAASPVTIIGPSLAPIFQVTNATANLEVDNVKMKGSTTVTSGSAITFVSSSGTVKLSGDTFTDFPHQAVEFLAQTGAVTIENSTFSGNESLVADADGGAISAGSVGDVTITGSTFDHNTAGHHGGALYLGAAHSVNISGSTFLSNTATDDGGAIEPDSLAADSTWAGNTFSGNSTTGSTSSVGGAAFDVGNVNTDVTFVIDTSSFSGNTSAAKTPPTSGAVGYVGNVIGTFQVLNSTMTGNSFTGIDATHSGIGIDLTVGTITSTGEFDLGQSTFDETAAGADYLIVSNSNAGFLRLASSTLNGPGILRVGSNSAAAANAVEFRDDIAVSTTATAAITVTGTPAEIGYSITSDAASAQLVGLTGAQFSVADPQLGALANNGGPTFTRLPLTGSPAIDTGDPAFTIPLVDQRGSGFTRIVNGRVDIGAVEVQGTTATAPTLSATGVDPSSTIWMATTALATGALLLGAFLLMRRRRNTAQ